MLDSLPKQRKQSEWITRERPTISQILKGTPIKGFEFISTGGSNDLLFHSKALPGGSFDDLHVELIAANIAAEDPRPNFFWVHRTIG